MIYSGNVISPGIAIGNIYIYRPYSPKVEEKNILESECAVAIEKYHTAVDLARGELAGMRDRMLAVGDDKAKIFEAHLEILDDEAAVEEIESLINNDLYAVPYAVDTAYNTLCMLISKSKDPLISERQTDIQDVKKRLLRCLDGVEEKSLSVLPGPVVIASRDLFPSDTASMDRSKVLGIITEIGGATSHTAIIAKSYGIPAVSGIADLTKNLRDGGPVVLDAINGMLICEPDSDCIKEYRRQQERELKKRQITLEFLEKEACTKDGIHIDIGQNIGSADVQELENSGLFDFVGLFRTEFLYMGRDHIPTEQEQFEAYKRVLLAYGGKPVTLRTLDIGGDKTLSYMPLPKEDNPFLGNRALRLCFDSPELFRVQLRAALRASVYGNLWLMLPMVGSMEDIRKAKAIINEVKSELEASGEKYSDSFKLGIMVEIPSIAVIADKAAKEVDFASIGTNDLCQYLTATDRMNPNVTQYYQNYHPAMFRMMKNVINEFLKAGKSVSICGELGGDVLAAPVLVGCGIRKLSMNANSSSKIKQVLSWFTISELESIANKILNMDSQEQIRPFLEKTFDR